MNCYFGLCASTQIGELSRSAAPRVGPKGPSAKLLAAIVEMKRRNPRCGRVRIAQQISHAIGVDLDKEVVCRVLAQDIVK